MTKINYDGREIQQPCVLSIIKVVKIQLLVAACRVRPPVDVITPLRLHNCKSFAGFLSSSPQGSVKF